MFQYASRTVPRKQGPQGRSDFSPRVSEHRLSREYLNLLAAGVERYLARVSGPLLVRIDIRLEGHRGGVYADAHMAARDIRTFCRGSDGAGALPRTAISGWLCRPGRTTAF